MSTLKPIIKLPPRNTTHNNNNNNNNNSNNNRLNPSNNNRTLTAESTTYSTSPKQQQLSISNELFFEDMDNKLTDYDIQNVLQGFKIFQIRREVGGGYISFLSARVAERVYTLLNGYMFTSQTVLKFRFSSNNDPQPEGDIWEISNLPLHIDHNSLYDIFRPYGPLSICKFLIEDTTATTTGHEGKALVQYFFRDDSDRASIEMNGKMIDGNIIQITLLLMNNKSSQNPMKVSSIPSHYQEATMTATDKKRDTGFVDFLNLYVKNLDPTVDNSDLFNLFRKFGRIVSARVMTNPQNGQSKGYGFVSFGKHEEAAAALEEMNGYQFRTKPIIVAYHEPKKPRQEKSSSTATSSFHSPPPPNSSLNGSAASFDYTPSVTATPYFDMKHPHDVVGPLNGLGIDHVDQLSMNIKVEELSVGTSKAMRVKQHKPSSAILTPSSLSSPSTAMRSTTNVSTYFQHNQNQRPSLASLASGANIQQIPPHIHYQQHNTIYDNVKKIEEGVINEQQQQREYPIYCQDYTNAVNGFPGTKKPSLRRRRSLESINSTMTESTAQIQRHRMTEAVKRCCMEIPALTMIVTNQQEQQINDIVDMLLTLRKKERSICLFNREFLKEKVQAAVEALEICEDEAEDEEEILLVDLKEATNTTGFNTSHKMAAMNGTVEAGMTRPIAQGSTASLAQSPVIESGSNGTNIAPVFSGAMSIKAINPAINSIPTATNDDVIIPPRQSKAIPIVAPNHLDATKQEEIRALLNSLEGKPIHEKKQQLGDQLFPLVKATGVRHAPKITICLLDSIELETLARIMYDKEALKVEVDKASAKL